MAGLLWYRSYMDSLANKSGYYPDIHAGHADRVTELTLDAPYLVRETPAGYNQLELMELVGGTVAWNQLFAIPTSNLSKTANGVTITDNRDGSYTISTVETGATANTNIRPVLVANGVTKDHKYYYWGLGEGQSASTWYLADAQNATLNYNRKDHGIANAASTNYLDLHIVVKSGAVITTPITVKPCTTDLTQMFGSTIADYVYTLEQATAGSGVAWLKSYDLIDDEYHAYSAPTLEHVKTTAHITKDADDNVLGTYPFDSSLLLRGIPKLDGEALIYDGDTYEPDGTVTRKYGTYTITGSEVWTSWGSCYYTGGKLSPAAPSSNTENCTCSKLVGTRRGDLYSGLKTSGIAVYGQIIYIGSSDYANIANLTGAEIVYVLATPTTESADPYTAVQDVAEGGTEEFVTGNNVPVGNVSVYRRA